MASKQVTLLNSSLGGYRNLLINFVNNYTLTSLFLTSEISSPFFLIPKEDSDKVLKMAKQDMWHDSVYCSTLTLGLTEQPCVQQ